MRERRSRSDARSSNSCSLPADIMWTRSASRSPPVPRVDDGHLADPADPAHLEVDERLERRRDALQRDHAGRQRRVDRRTLQRGIEAARGDLYLGQLRHEAEAYEGG